MIGINLKGKTALVTGGTSGIGHQIVKTLLQAGANVIFMGTSEEKAEGVIQECLTFKKEEQQLLFKKVNVADFQFVQDAVQECYKQFENIDILVNCAGITKDKLMLKMTEEDWDSVIDINLKSAFNLSKAVIRQMMKARSGKIINISSVVGLTGNPGQVNYSASKSGMIGFTQSLAKELAARNICVNCVAPGFIQTKMTDELSEEQKQALYGKIPLARFGRVEDVANLVLFLSSSLSDYITGEVIAVDGGMTA
ncbi:MAG: 3-oxoacyl-[acyl-carrier-protein] reductase [Chlamydiae bacterium]|jgi:3-oxoacyl-[acyl-carrier protein] reductase|nr:3-oxoacyl-[acyl-carrier-protein] reductase [Chlamydiota bacterium]